MGDEYSILHYASMHADRGRVEPYIAAVERAVEPDSFVLEIGTGTGLIACASALAGARRVVAIEPHPVIELAKKIAAENGLSDRVEFVAGLSTDWECDERADIVVADLRGALPYHPGNVESMIDARERLLAHDGALIARRDRLYAAPVEVPKAYARRLGFCTDGPFSASALREILVNRPLQSAVEPKHLLGERRLLDTLDYRTVKRDGFDAAVDFELSRDGTLHGFVVWFESELDDVGRVSTAPGEQLLAYGRLVFPVADPFAVHRGEEVRLRFEVVRAGAGYVTSWAGEIDGDADRSFDQSTLGVHRYESRPRRVVAGDDAPRACSRSEALRTLLGAMDGEHRFDDLIELVHREHGQLFGNEARLRSWVADMVAEHGV